MRAEVRLENTNTSNIQTEENGRRPPEFFSRLDRLKFHIFLHILMRYGELECDGQRRIP